MKNIKTPKIETEFIIIVSQVDAKRLYKIQLQDDQYLQLSSYNLIDRQTEFYVLNNYANNRQDNISKGINPDLPAVFIMVFSSKCYKN